MDYSRLLGDLINTVKARAAGRLEGARGSHTDLIHTPEFIFEETAHQVSRLTEHFESCISLNYEAFYLHHWEIGWANFSDFVTVYSDFPENRIRIVCVL